MAAVGGYVRWKDRCQGRLPVPGTSSVIHLEEDIAAAGLVLWDAEFAAIARAA